MKTVILIDGGYLRARAKAAAKTYDNEFIETFARKCLNEGEHLLRVLHYDSPQYRGKAQLPVSGEQTTFSASDKWLVDLAKLDKFAVRRGALGFRGWKPKAIPLAGGRPLTDADFSPVFEQKGVDMRIGLDIASMSDQKTVDHIVLVSGDTDMIPAMKHARKAGIEVTVVQLASPSAVLHDSLLAHADSLRPVAWP